MADTFGGPCYLHSWVKILKGIVSSQGFETEYVLMNSSEMFREVSTCDLLTFLLLCYGQ